MVATHGARGRMADPALLAGSPLCDLEQLRAARQAVAEIHLSEEVVDYIVRLVEATRAHPSVVCGASPRAATMLAVGCRARAAVLGESYVVPDIVKALAVPALAHRLALEPVADLEGQTAENILELILAETPVPR